MYLLMKTFKQVLLSFPEVTCPLRYTSLLPTKKDLSSNTVELFLNKIREKANLVREMVLCIKNPLILLRLLGDLPLMQLLKYQKMSLKLLHSSRVNYQHVTSR